MIKKSGKLLVAATAAATMLVTAAGCGGSGSSSTSGSRTSGGPTSGGTTSGVTGKTYTIGVLADLTGPAASGAKTTPEGVKAGVKLAARDGVNLKYVVADTGTSPATALAGAQKLVTRDHVIAVVAVSAITFAAANYLTAHGVPVVGEEDSTEWITSKNMFSTFGAQDQKKVATTIGAFLKMQGVTTLAALGYGISPVSADSATAMAESAQAAGIKVGYLNVKFPFGSTNVAPVALAMKKAGVDAFIAAVDPNTSFALITALRQQGVNLKVALLPLGYGGDLLQAGPGALKAAQNVYFLLSYEPVEMRTAATRQFAADLTTAGVTGTPTFAEYVAYISVGLLVRGIKGAGAAPTPASLLAALSTIHDFDGLGLFGGHRIDLTNRSGVPAGIDNCGWITKLEGTTFRPVAGATPICGSEIKPVKITPAS